MSDARNFTEIPRIDLSLADDPATESRLLSDLRHALTHIGFLYVENHGVSQDAVTALVDALPTLFSLADQAKAEVALTRSPHFLGYSADGSETTAGQADRREQFEFANELTTTWTDGAPISERLRGPNPVDDPPRVPGVVLNQRRTVWQAYADIRPTSGLPPIPRYGPLLRTTSRR